MLSPCDQTWRRRLRWRPCSYPSCTSAARRQRDRERDKRRAREDSGHVRPFQEEDDEHDGQKVPRRRRRVGAAAAAAGSRFHSQALLLRRRRPAVAGRHEQLPLGSHWIPPSLAGWLGSLLGSWSPPRRRGGEVEKSRRAANIVLRNSASNQPGVRQWLLGTGYCCRYNWLGLARVRGAKTETLERKVDKKGISNVLFFL